MGFELLDHRPRIGAACVHNSSHDTSRLNWRAVRILRDRHHGPVVDRCASGPCRPELSPCQPLLKPMSPSLRCSGEIVILPPRFGTSCHIRRLAFDMSIGFTRKNVALYSTLPFAFLGASLMSLMIVLCGSFGSSSPKTRLAIVSYCPRFRTLRRRRRARSFRVDHELRYRACTGVKAAINPAASSALAKDGIVAT